MASASAKTLVVARMRRMARSGVASSGARTDMMSPEPWWEGLLHVFAGAGAGVAPAPRNT